MAVAVTTNQLCTAWPSREGKGFHLAQRSPASGDSYPQDPRSPAQCAKKSAPGFPCAWQGFLRPGRRGSWPWTATGQTLSAALSLPAPAAFASLPTARAEKGLCPSMFGLEQSYCLVRLCLVKITVWTGWKTGPWNCPQGSGQVTQKEWVFRLLHLGQIPVIRCCWATPRTALWLIETYKMVGEGKGRACAVWTGRWLVHTDFL